MIVLMWVAHEHDWLPSTIFKRWYPDMDLEVEEMPVAA